MDHWAGVRAGPCPDRSPGSSRRRRVAGDLLDLERDAGTEQRQPGKTVRRLRHAGVDDVRQGLQEGVGLGWAHAFQMSPDVGLQEHRSVEARGMTVELNVTLSGGVYRLVGSGHVGSQLRSLRDLALKSRLEHLLDDLVVERYPIPDHFDRDGEAVNFLAG